jgi:hypothetical protein
MVNQEPVPGARYFSGPKREKTSESQKANTNVRGIEVRKVCCASETHSALIVYDKSAAILTLTTVGVARKREGKQN